VLTQTIPADLEVPFGVDFGEVDGAAALEDEAAVSEGAGAELVVFPGLEGLSVERGEDVPLSSGVAGFDAGLAFVAVLDPLPAAFAVSAEPDVSEGGGAEPVVFPGLDGLSVGRGVEVPPSAGVEVAPEESVVPAAFFFFFFLVWAAESF
jgi:hypothetical protein